tara:strand:- start:344 stop:1666 length:1323 start_codon:yes stop_codon:yes gene_type:complete
MFLVYGLQKSGIAITKLLEKKNIEFKIWDDNKKNIKNLKKILNPKFFLEKNKCNLTNFNKIFVSPGISIRQKKFKIKNKSRKIKRDLNLYMSNLKNQKIIAITGTNGKSTTTKLIGDILKKKKIKTFVGGNIGEPLCNAFLLNNKFHYHVIELSSFQLETVKNIDTKISIITNLSNDHLDRYKNVNDYVNQKKNIITFTGTNLISIDDNFSKKIYSNNKFINKISFSILDPKADVYMGNNFILDNYFKKNKKIYIKNISKDLEGHFNNQNILIAYICIKLLKISEKYFFEVIEKFIGLPHRSKVIIENKKFKIINNSKSTNLNSCINSITNYDNIYLIIGGIAKEKNFETLLDFKKKIKCIYLYGKSAEFIEKKLKKSINIKKFQDLELVIKQVSKDVKKTKIKPIILFAPACSSYDQYDNFEKRGEHFTKLIQSYLIKL